jgi:uncharacterized protein (TIGR03067 family)
VKLHVLLILTVALLPTRAATQTAAAKKELARFQGTWRLVAREIEGKKATPRTVEAADSTLTFKDAKVTYRSQGEDIWTATVKLDPARSPKLVEVTYLTGPEKGKTGRAIYKLEGDRLTVCFSSTQLPTDFTTEDTDRALVVYQREKK